MINDPFVPQQSYFDPTAGRVPKAGQFAPIKFHDALGALIATGWIQADENLSCRPQTRLPKICDYQCVEFTMNVRDRNFDLRVVEELMTALHGHIGGMFEPTYIIHDGESRQGVWLMVGLKALRGLIDNFGGLIERSHLSRPTPIAEVLDRLGVSPESDRRTFNDLVRSMTDGASTETGPIAALQVRIATECPDAPLISQRELGVALMHRATLAYVTNHAPAATPAP